jgi:hypothetical protein
MPLAAACYSASGTAIDLHEAFVSTRWFDNRHGSRAWVYRFFEKKRSILPKILKTKGRKFSCLGDLWF